MTMLNRLDIVFAPLLPEWLIAIGAGLALLLAAASWRAGLPAAGLALRLLAAAALALALLNPQMRHARLQPLDDIAIIVADLSSSQAIDARDARTRAASRELSRRLAALPNTETRTVFLRADDGRRGTRLIAALRDALADVPPERLAAVFLLTDGQVHDMPTRAAAALPPGYAAPVHVLITGRRAERDRWVRIERAARFGIVGQRVQLRFTVRQHPAPRPPAPVEIVVRLNGREYQRLRARTQEPVDIDLPVRHAGQNIVEIIAGAMPGGELSTRNNHAVHVFKGVRDRLKVLLVSGKPHPGERVWRDLLKSDPMVDLVHFTILRPPEKQDGTPIRELALIAFPTYELFVEKLNNFDLIIFDRYQRRAILPRDYLLNIVEYVRRGGAVLLTVGPEFAEPDSLYDTPLGELLPAAPTGTIIEQPFRARLSDTGARHPLTRVLAPARGGRDTWGRWYRVIAATPADDAQLLMRGARDMPLLALRRHGEGRVAALLSDHVWLWARRHDGGGPHVELMRRLAHWLMKEPELEEEQLTGRQEGLDLVIRRQTLADNAPPLTVEMPDGSTRALSWTRRAPGDFEARVRDAPAGLYRLRSGDLERMAAIGAIDTLEMRTLIASAAPLAPLAALSGGGTRWIAAGAGAQVRLPRLVKVARGMPAHGGGWLGVARAGAARTLDISHVPLFSGAAALAVLLLLLAAAWRRESR